MKKPWYKKLWKNLPELGAFTVVPARWIAHAYKTQPNSGLGRFWSMFKIRTMYVFAFFPLVLVDTLIAGSLGFRYALGSFILTDSAQDQRLAQQKKYATFFSKNLYAIAMSVLGIASPKFVTHYFTQASKIKGVSAGGRLSHEPHAKLVQPETIDKLIELLKRANHEGKKIMPIGAGRSQGRQFLPDGEKGGYVIDLSKCCSKLVIDPDENNPTATVGAGVTWNEIEEAAGKLGLSVKVSQASPVFKAVSSFAGPNAHGWDIHAGMLSNTVLSIKFMNAQGEIKELTPQDDLFHHVAGSYGILGIVIEMKISLAKNYRLTEKGKQISIKDYVSHFEKEVITNPAIHLHLFRLSLNPDSLLGHGIAVDYVREGNEPPVYMSHLKPEDARGTRFDRIAIHLAGLLGWVRGKYWSDERSRLLANQAKPMTRNEIMQPKINALFDEDESQAAWLQEYFLPGENLAAFIKELADLLKMNQVALLNASVRFVKQNNKSYMSYADNGDRYAVVLCFNQSLKEEEIIKARKWIREAQELSVKMGGTFYLPYQDVVSPELFRKAYPKYIEMQRLKEKLDPDGLFVSGFYTKHIQTKPEQNNHFKAMMNHTETRNSFKGFLEKILQRVESDKLYELIDDVMLYCDSRAEIYAELQKRLSEITPSTINALRRILGSLADIKKELGDQAKSLLFPMKRINGLVEIGYPGRFIAGFQSHFNVVGKKIAVYEAPSPTDYIQTGFPRPYDQFAKLDYANPSLAGLADASADVITIYIGLHHFSDKPDQTGESSLDRFLKDIRRVLREGGQLLLVDHDVRNETDFLMADMAHEIFNLVNGVDLKTNLAEIRNFNSIAYWAEKLAKHGLAYTVNGPDVSLIRDGDPTRNRMVSFKAVPKPELKNNIKLQQQPEPEEESLKWKKNKNTSVVSQTSLFTGSAGKQEVGTGTPTNTETMRHRRLG